MVTSDVVDFELHVAILSISLIDELYIDGPCGSETLAGVLLARFERVSHMTHFYKKDH